MQVGLRPRLKGRPSFYDLIKQRNIDKLSIATAKLVKDEPELVASHLPLPASPTSSKELALPHLLTPRIGEGSIPTDIEEFVRMVPVRLQSHLYTDR
jgi:V-type H+-transporting ATPase subunit A